MDDDKRIDSDDQQGAMQQDSEEATDSHSDYRPTSRFDASAVHHLSGMYKNLSLIHI